MELLETKAGGSTNKQIKQRLCNMGEAMKSLRRDYDDHFKELQMHFNPRRGRFDIDTPKRKVGGKMNDSILNSRGRLALRTLQSGMQAGITSPARSWFQLLAADQDLRKRHAVRGYVDSTARIMREMLQSTGTYNALHVGYGDLGLLGTDCAILDEDARDGFMLHQLPPGQFWLAANGRNEVDTLYFEDWLTVEQVVGRFVYRGDPRNEPDWTVCSGTVRRLWDQGKRFELVHVARIIAPRRNRDPYLETPDNKPVASIWWEIGASGEQLLRDSGYDANPLIASRWYREGSNVWGDSPGMDALPDVKMLQVIERDKNEAVKRMNRPPMNAPTSFRNTPFSTAPGAMNFTDDKDGLRPAYEVDPPINHMREDIRATEERIDEAMYADLFRMLANSDRRQITAREIDELREEKLIGLGPVLELQHREKLRPLLLGIYRIGLKQKRFEPAPEELDGKALVIDYISILAQAQRAITTGGIEKLFGFTGNLAGVMPDVLDRLDGDAAVEEYAGALGVTPKVLRDEDAVKEIRQGRAQQQQAAQTAEMMAKAGPGFKAGVEGAQLLSQAPGSNVAASPRDALNRIGAGIAI